MLHEIRVLEVKANLEKNAFQDNEINWKERVTFPNEGNDNWSNAHKETKLVETTETKFNI